MENRSVYMMHEHGGTFGCTIHIYLNSAFYNRHRFKAAVREMNEPTLEFRVICYQR